MKLLLDTNILIDYYARRSPFFEGAVKLRIAQAFGDVELWASALSFNDVEYVLRGAVGVEKLRGMMSKSLEFLDICVPAVQDVHAGLESDWPDLESYLVAASAQRVQADYIITRDKRGFEKSPIPALAPDSFIDLMRTDYGVTYDELSLADRLA